MKSGNASAARADAARAAFAARASAFAASDAFAASAFAAADAASVSAAAAAAYAARVARAAATIWASVSRDASALEAGLSPQALLELPLWPQGEPYWASRAWSELKTYLDQFPDEHWEVWTDWYEGRRDVAPIDWDLQRDRVMIPFEENLWEQGPAVVNARIKAIIEAHQARLSPSEETAAPAPAPQAPPSAASEPLEPPQQQPHALHFKEENGLVVADPAADADKIATDRRGAALHADALAAAAKFHQLIRGANDPHPDSEELGRAAQRLSEALGPLVEETEPALLVSAAVELERLYGRYDPDPDGKTVAAPLEPKEFEAFGRMMEEARYFITLDQTLAAYMRVYRQAPETLPRIGAGMEAVRKIRDEGLTDDKTVETLEILAREDNEGSRRAFYNFFAKVIAIADGLKNFAAKNGGKIWAGRGLVAKTALGAGGALATAYAFGNFLVNNQDWFQRNIPALVSYIEDLARIFPLQ